MYHWPGGRWGFWHPNSNPSNPMRTVTRADQEMEANSLREAMSGEIAQVVEEVHEGIDTVLILLENNSPPLKK